MAPKTSSKAIQLRLPERTVRLPDNDQWENRFEIKSESSDRIYIISQNKDKRHWGCSCPSWRTRRACKHIASIGLPAHERPYEVLISGGSDGSE